MLRIARILIGGAIMLAGVAFAVVSVFAGAIVDSHGHQLYSPSLAGVVGMLVGAFGAWVAGILPDN